jgi:Na+-transporting methylmalonyl-CoA/oxaloacetate decarboxylase gamma subunit
VRLCSPRRLKAVLLHSKDPGLGWEPLLVDLFLTCRCALLLLQAIIVAGIMLLAVFGWFAKKAINKLAAEEEEREAAEEAAQQQQEAEASAAAAAAAAAAKAPADMEAGTSASTVAGAKDVDVVPHTGRDQQQQQQQEEGGLDGPRMVWQDSDLALQRGLASSSK